MNDGMLKAILFNTNFFFFLPPRTSSRSHRAEGSIPERLERADQYHAGGAIYPPVQFQQTRDTSE